MAIILNDNLKIRGPLPSDSRYFNNLLPYSGVSEVNSIILIGERHEGLTVLIESGASNIEYWYKVGVTDVDLVEKKFGSEQLVGDFVTGATNLGYFTGQTGIQRLALSSFPDITSGFYFSEYNWYYGDSDGIVRIGSPTYNGILRRAYVKTDKSYSWIYNVNVDGWSVATGDITENVGDLIVDNSYGTRYTEEEWTVFATSGTTSISPSGSLTTGDTLTIGNPVYNDKSDQNLNLRTFKTETPTIINLHYDDNFIYLSGNSENQTITASNGLTKVGQNISLGGVLTGATTITATGTTSLKFTDTRTTTTGIEYDDDYSSGFADNSLVNKIYVDDKLTSFGGERIYKTISQTAHGFDVDDVVGWSGATILNGHYNKPIANGLYDGEVLGIVSDCFDDNSFELTQAGYVTGLTASYTPNSTYFLSASVSGLLTDVEPIVTSYLSKSMFLATSTSTGWVLPYAGYVITSGVTGGALVKTVCNPISNYTAVSTDYYIGASGGTVVQLSGAQTNGQVIVVADVYNSASVGNPIQVAGPFFGGSFVSEINTAYGSMTYIYNAEKVCWSIVGFSPAIV